jgi:seryl-tRNA synthetase
MRILISTISATALLLALGGAAAGQNVAPAATKDVKQPGPPSLRYRFTHVADGVMRLDGETGEVLHCRQQGAAWICSVVPHDGPVLKAQLQQAETDKDKLAGQMSELQRQLGMTDEEKQALKTAIESLQQDMSTLKAQMPAAGAADAVKDEIARMRKDNESLAAALASLRRDIAALRAQMPAPDAGEAVKGEVARLRKDNESLAGEAASLRKEIAALKTQVAAQASDTTQRQEIARLEKENAELKDRLAALQIESATMQRQIVELTPPPPPVPPAAVPAPQTKESDKELKMPSREELAQARAAIVEAWRRVMEMMNDLRKDLTGRNDDAPVKL